MQTTAPMEGGTPPVTTSSAGGPVDAAKLAVEAGGLHGGRKRRDGLTPGSPEALEADRKKDAERKKKARALGRGEPPPLPPAMEPVKLDTPQAVGTGPATLPDSPPWQADTLAPLFKELVPLIENTCVDGLTERAQKAGFSPAMVAEVRKDARWNETAKAGLLSAGPQVAAKYLSKTGIPADAAPEVVLGTSIIAIFIGHKMLASKLDDMAKDRGDKPPAQNPDAQS